MGWSVDILNWWQKKTLLSEKLTQHLWLGSLGASPQPSAHGASPQVATSPSSGDVAVPSEELWNQPWWIHFLPLSNGLLVVSLSSVHSLPLYPFSSVVSRVPLFSFGRSINSASTPSIDTYNPRGFGPFLKTRFSSLKTPCAKATTWFAWFLRSHLIWTQNQLDYAIRIYICVF